MKSTLVIGLAIGLVVALVTGAVAAAPGDGMAMGPDHGMKGSMSCPKMPPKWTPEQTQKFIQFQKDILPLRQQMLKLRTDLMILHLQEPRDWKALADTEKQMVDVRTEIQKRATDAGFPAMGAHHRGGKDMEKPGMHSRGMHGSEMHSGMCGQDM
ncbi:MAG: hypothetical protein ACLPX5_06295 [Dissulfurispiraceae bacterium]